MTEPETTRVTELLLSMAADSAPDVTRELLPLVYRELRDAAGRLLGRERRDHTLQATALVHEAYVKLVDQTRVNWQGRTHFLAVGAQAMRRILIDHAKGRKREKRGGDWVRVTLSDPGDAAGAREVDLDRFLLIDAALIRLARLDPRQASVVELRFFGGLSMAEVAEFLNVSKRTVEEDWSHARAWLRRELDRAL